MAYAWYTDLTIDNTKVPSNQTDFPVLFSKTLNRLRTVPNGGHVQNANGFDIVFSPNADGSAKYSHEIEYYNPATGEFIADVKIPTVRGSAPDTAFYIVYGDAAIAVSQEDVVNVWDTNFYAVWHLNETAGVRWDSTSRNNDLQDNNTVTWMAGQIHQAAYFTKANSEFLSITDALQTGLDLSNIDFTIEVWMYHTATEYDEIGIIGKYTDPPDPGDHYQYYGNWDGSDDNLALTVRDNWVGDTERPSWGAAGIAPATWYYITLTYDHGTGDLIWGKDAAYDGADNMGQSSDGNTADVQVGRVNSYAVFYMDGAFDEMRISLIDRSADWLTTTYNNQDAPCTFVVVGAEHAAVPPVPVIEKYKIWEHGYPRTPLKTLKAPRRR